MSVAYYSKNVSAAHTVASRGDFSKTALLGGVLHFTISTLKCLPSCDLTSSTCSELRKRIKCFYESDLGVSQSLLYLPLAGTQWSCGHTMCMSPSCVPRRDRQCGDSSSACHSQPSGPQSLSLPLETEHTPTPGSRDTSH